MFGHQDDNNQNNDDNNAVQDDQSKASLEVEETLPTPSLSSESTPNSQPSDESWQDSVSPAGGFPQAAGDKFHSTSTPADPKSSNDDDLIDAKDTELVVVKQKALTELFPLIDKLDQTPEERFKTIMMMIQASDNQNLIQSAYEAAHKITDENVKAQALLDVVNEINYFTHQPES